MKKTIVIGLALLTCIGIVVGGSISNLNYMDRVMFWDTPRQVDDNDVDIDADTLDGHSYANIRSKSIQDDEKLWMHFTNEDTGLKETISDNQAQWSQDRYGSGISFNTLERTLTGQKDGLDNYENYLDLLVENFALRTELYYLEAKLALIENYLDLQINDTQIQWKMSMLEADRSGKETKTSDGFSCPPEKNTCYRLTEWNWSSPKKPIKFVVNWTEPDMNVSIIAPNGTINVTNSTVQVNE